MGPVAASSQNLETDEIEEIDRDKYTTRRTQR